MSKAKARAKLLPFDAARYLTDDAAVAEYMTAVLETDDPDLLLLAGRRSASQEWRKLPKMPGLGVRVFTKPSHRAPSPASIPYSKWLGR